MRRDDQSEQIALLGLAIRALARHGVRLVVMSRPGGLDFEIDGKPVSEADVLMRAATLDARLLVEMFRDRHSEVRRAA